MPVVRRQVAKVYKDISLSMDINPMTQDIVALFNRSAISQSIKNIVLTDLGERPFQPDLGSEIGNSLFELSTTVPTDYIITRVKNSIILNEPRVEVKDVEVDFQPDENSYNIDISYVVTGDPSIFTVTVILEPTNFS